MGKRKARAPILYTPKQLELEKTKMLNPDLRRQRPFLRRAGWAANAPRAPLRWGEMPKENPRSTQPSRFTNRLVTPRLPELDETPADDDKLLVCKHLFHPDASGPPPFLRPCPSSLNRAHP